MLGSQLPGKRQHHFATRAAEPATGLGSKRHARRGLDRLGHLENAQSLPVRVREAVGDAVGAHRVEQHGIVDDLFLPGGRLRFETREAAKEPLDRARRNPQRRQEDLRTAPVPHPRHPLLLPRERRKQEEQVPVEDGLARCYCLGRGNHSLDVAVIRDAVEADCERPDVLLDVSARLTLHEGILAS